MCILQDLSVTTLLSTLPDSCLIYARKLNRVYIRAIKCNLEMLVRLMWPNVSLAASRSTIVSSTIGLAASLLHPKNNLITLSGVDARCNEDQKSCMGNIRESGLGFVVGGRRLLISKALQFEQFCYMLRGDQSVVMMNSEIVIKAHKKLLVWLMGTKHLTNDMTSNFRV